AEPDPDGSSVNGAAAASDPASTTSNPLPPQTVRIDMPSDHPVRVLTAASSDPRFVPILESRIDDESMVLTVIPVEPIETRALAWITLTTDMEEGRWHEVKLPIVMNSGPRRRPSTTTASRSIRK